MSSTSASPPRGFFVTGTDTGVGKTVLSAALLASMSAAGVRVRAYKPAVTGLDEPGAPLHDHELLASVSGGDPLDVSPLRYGPAVSPHLAAALAGEPVSGGTVLAAARSVAAEAAAASATLIVEGVGGLLVPLTDDVDVRALATALALPLIVAARPGLGTINHTLLTIEAARAVGLRVAAVVLTPWPERPSALERSNAETIAQTAEVEVAGLAEVPELSGATGPAEGSRSNEVAGALADAGAELPWRRWLDHSQIA